MIWFTANGATLAPGLVAAYSARAVSMVSIHGSSASAGRALRAGNDPITPLVHCATTRLGLETMNIGAAITGSDMRLFNFSTSDTSFLRGRCQAPNLLRMR